MKLLVFAHTPPPHHGQSYMVQLMLAGFGGNRRKRAKRKLGSNTPFDIECYHVNAQVSKELEDIGDFRFGKLFSLVGYCLQAIWCRYRYGVTTMYYIPAPGKHSALYRDWIVMLLCRPFFRQIILHWHAAGLAKWLETRVQIRQRAFTYQRLKDVALSIVLSEYNRADAEKLLPRQIRVVNNGIPDPAPILKKTSCPAATRAAPPGKNSPPAKPLPPPILKTPAATRKFSRSFISPIAPAKKGCLTPSRASCAPTRCWPRANPLCPSA